jgi:hypothetical protein
MECRSCSIRARSQFDQARDDRDTPAILSNTAVARRHGGHKVKIGNALQIILEASSLIRRLRRASHPPWSSSPRQQPASLLTTIRKAISRAATPTAAACRQEGPLNGCYRSASLECYLLRRRHSFIGSRFKETVMTIRRWLGLALACTTLASGGLAGAQGAGGTGGSGGVGGASGGGGAGAAQAGGSAGTGMGHGAGNATGSGSGSSTGSGAPSDNNTRRNGSSQATGATGGSDRSTSDPRRGDARSGQAWGASSGNGSGAGTGAAAGTGIGGGGGGGAAGTVGGGAGSGGR